MNSSPFDAALDEPVLSPRRRSAALAVLIAAVTLLAVDNTVLSLAVPSMTRDLQPTAEQVLWIGDIYSLTIAGLLVLMGNIADRIGRKRLLLIGAVAFGGASLVAAFAWSAEALIAGRLLLGIAGATIMPSTLSILRNMYPIARERTRAIAIWVAGFSAGSAAGPLVGGALLNNFWWGSVFLINIPVMLLVLVTGLWLLPESRNREPGRFDVGSAVLSFLTAVSLVYAIKHAVGSGVDASFAISLTVGLAAGAWFIRRQRRLDVPMVDVELFRRPAFSGAVVANVIAIFALTGLVFFFSQYLQLVRRLSPLHAGLVELPATLASVLVIGLVGISVTRLGRGRAIAIALAVSAMSLGAVALAIDNGSLAFLVSVLIPVGLGTGLAMTLTGDAIMSAAPPERAGSVSAITETATELGTVMGIAVLGSVLTGVYRASVTLPTGTPDTVGTAVEDSLASALVTVDHTSALGQMAGDAFLTAIEVTASVAGVLTLVAAIVAWKLIPSPPETQADA